MALTKDEQVTFMGNIIKMLEETIFTKERELEFANFQKLMEQDWEMFAEKTKHELKILNAKLKFYNARLENMKK